MENQSKVAVLGAGIMGSCLSLALAKKRISVDLFDTNTQAMLGASLHNEGKLHLGFVYAKDSTKKTTDLLIKGSLSFNSIIKNLTNASLFKIEQALPFHYFVPNDSQLNIDEITKHFEAVDDKIKDCLQNVFFEDLQIEAEEPSFKKLTDKKIERLFNPQNIQGAFETKEGAVKPSTVATLLQDALLKTENIKCLFNSSVEKVERNEKDITVFWKNNICAPKLQKQKYKIVVNCLWDDKQRIDHSAGVLDTTEWIYRYKATLNIFTDPQNLKKIPSATGILGLYGDVVKYNDGQMYLSWYPKCKRGETSGLDGRSLHKKNHPMIVQNIRDALSKNTKLADYLSGLVHNHYVNNNIKEMGKYIPELKPLLHRSKSYKIGGGVILAKGKTDIDDPDSRLHQRFEIGPFFHGNYITIDTGKYCMGPYYAIETANKIQEMI